MLKTHFRNLSWLGLIGLMFVLMAVPAVVAQGKNSKSPEAAAQATAAAAKVDINNATEKQLEALSGVGKATAGKIIAGRPFTSVDDLAKAGVSKSTIAKIAPLVTVGAAPAAAKLAPIAPVAKPVAPATASVTKAAPETPTVYNPPPATGMVWVNLGTKVYHKEGDRWYGKTKNGKYMTETDAIKAGYRAVKEREKK
jgi:hypothetical protein